MPCLAQSRILRVTSTPALFTETHRRTRAVPGAEGIPKEWGRALALNGILSEAAHHKRDGCKAGICAKHHGQPSSRFRLTLSQQFQRVTGATPHAESGAASKCCHLCPPVPWGRVTHKEHFRGQRVLWSSNQQTQDKYISKKSPSHFFELINVGKKNNK